MRKIIGLLLLILAGCAPVSRKPPAAPAVPEALQRLRPGRHPVFKDDLSKPSLLAAAEKSLRYFTSDLRRPKTSRIGKTDYAEGILIETLKEFIHIQKETETPEEIQHKISENFDVYRSLGSDGQGKVVFSGYYAPILQASPAEEGKFRYPIYKKPPDMVEVNLEDFNPDWKGKAITGRVQDGKLVPYLSRRDIDIRGAFKGQGLDIAWLADKFDVLDLHIQGSGILQFPDGKEVLAKFAATNNHPYKSIGLALVQSGALPKEGLSSEKIRQYLREHPEAQDWVYSQNPRYTFFEIAPLPEDKEPDGTIRQSLTAGRSIAIDPLYIPLGALAFISTPLPIADEEGNILGMETTTRFVLCQDTGGAIKGPGRVDLYTGYGKQAKAIASRIWNEGQLYILIKKLPPRKR